MGEQRNQCGKCGSHGGGWGCEQDNDSKNKMNEMGPRHVFLRAYLKGKHWAWWKGRYQGFYLEHF